MSNYGRTYIDLSEEEIETIKRQILKVGTDNFNIEEHNITKDCYDVLVEEIITGGITGYDEEEYDEVDYWEEREREELENLYHEDE